MNKIKDTFKDKMKEAGWLLPGLEVKRWFALIFLGSLFITIGLMIFFNLRPVYFIMEFIRKIAQTVPTDILAVVMTLGGVFLFFKFLHPLFFPLRRGFLFFRLQ